MQIKRLLWVISNEHEKHQEIRNFNTTNACKYANEQLWKSLIAPNLLKIVVVNPDNLSLYDLAGYIDFLKKIIKSPMFLSWLLGAHCQSFGHFYYAAVIRTLCYRC